MHRPLNRKVESYSLIIHRHDHLRDVVPDVVAFGSCVILRDGCSRIDTDVEGFGYGKHAGLGPLNLAFANLFPIDKQRYRAGSAVGPFAIVTRPRFMYHPLC
jgi:hypothetical protein